MGSGFCPLRRDVSCLQARDAPVQPRLDTLELSAGVKNWGYQLRFGLFSISDRGLRIVAAAMPARLPS
jgi:hypothetical protein